MTWIRIETIRIHIPGCVKFYIILIKDLIYQQSTPNYASFKNRYKNFLILDQVIELHVLQKQDRLLPYGQLNSLIYPLKIIYITLKLVKTGYSFSGIDDSCPVCLKQKYYGFSLLCRI